jgi:hypothetical protein
MLEEIDQHGVTRTIDGSALTFKQLADHYEREYAIPAQYDKHGIKTAGLRSYRDALRKLMLLRSQFTRRVKDISYGDLAAFNRLRLSTPYYLK